MICYRFLLFIFSMFFRFLSSLILLCRRFLFLLFFFRFLLALLFDTVLLFSMDNFCTIIDILKWTSLYSEISLRWRWLWRRWLSLSRVSLYSYWLLLQLLLLWRLLLIRRFIGGFIRGFIRRRLVKLCLLLPLGRCWFLWIWHVFTGIFKFGHFNFELRSFWR